MLPCTPMTGALVDLSALDLSRDVVSEEELREVIPHRAEFALIDGICHLDLERGVVVGYKDWGERPWWAAGHIPGRHIMPGVLLIEGAAQVSTFLIKKNRHWPEDRFVGLGGLNRVRFRGQVVPPSRVYFASAMGSVSGLRLARYPAEAWCEGKRVMDMELLGVLL